MTKLSNRINIGLTQFTDGGGGVLNRQGQDQKIFKKLIRFLSNEKSSAKFPGELILHIGKFFLGAPYRVGLLETQGTERLVVNLREHDCVTFVENVVALAWLIKSREKSFKAFQRILLKIRYRHGRLEGYCSRLHYFSDWIDDNHKKGILREVTAEIGGRPLQKSMAFMTKHPDLYPQLKNRANFRRMQLVERRMSRRSLFFIPKKALRRLEDRICDGDLIAITTKREGLDVQHVGLAAKVKNRIHLLQASSAVGKVVLSKQTLHQYLMQRRTCSGIVVARIF